MTRSEQQDVSTPPIPPDEEARLAALRATGILDTAPERRFDAITREAQGRLHTPIALMSLVDAERQWFKSRQGIDAEETPRAVSFCGHAINYEGAFVVPDARLDPRFAGNVLVNEGPRVRFYAGYPITSPEGHRVGMLCVLDRQPRTASDEEQAVLRALAREVEEQLWPAELVPA